MPPEETSAAGEAGPVPGLCLGSSPLPPPIRVGAEPGPARWPGARGGREGGRRRRLLPAPSLLARQQGRGPLAWGRAVRRAGRPAHADGAGDDAGGRGPVRRRAGVGCGDTAAQRNWYVDEPSCGSEICVVMYHQPSAPPGVGGPYTFQWNDDRCNMKNNFICKYSLEKPTNAPTENSQRDVATEPLNAVFPEERHTKDANVTVAEAKEPVQSLAYILIPSIPVLLLLMVITAIFWFWLFAKRRQERIDVSPKEEDAWLSNPRRSSPNLDIYKVIKKQSEADLAGTRPETKNSSFRTQEDKVLDSLSRDYDDAAINTSTSGFVTLASTESGFVTNDIYELCGDRVGRSKESTWVENEIYGY
ncbi:layilin isoform X4 [Balearica regulorum gibbericeps]|uniref:layilin isoform X4 n=1 Tax=Balearica regulorum gibbericeps TaxID=100784 RepID=UPI003F615FDD